MLINFILFLLPIPLFLFCSLFAIKGLFFFVLREQLNIFAVCLCLFCVVIRLYFKLYNIFNGFFVSSLILCLLRVCLNVCVSVSVCVWGGDMNDLPFAFAFRSFSLRLFLQQCFRLNKKQQLTLLCVVFCHLTTPIVCVSKGCVTNRKPKRRVLDECEGGDLWVCVSSGSLF